MQWLDFECYRMIKWSEKSRPMTNGIKAMSKCGNFGSVYSPTNTPFIRESNGAMLMMMSTTLFRGGFKDPGL